MTRIGLIGCGASKKKGVHKAKDLYTSNYFQLKREYAEKVCDTWYILSAKHGLISPEKEIEAYDRSLSDMGSHPTYEWALTVAQDLHTRTDELGRDEYEGVHRLVWLAGEDYVQPVEQLVMDDEVDPFVPRSQMPFRKTSGIGKQMAWLKEEIEEASTETRETTLAQFSGGERP